MLPTSRSSSGWAGMSVRVTELLPFPWGRLPRFSKAGVERARHARQAVERALRTDALAAALRQLAVADAEVVVLDIGVADDDAVRSLPEARVGLRLADDSADLLLGVDPALATDVLRRVLARPIGLDDPRAHWSPALQGALEAVVLELARQSAGKRAVAVVVAPVVSASEPISGIGGVVIRGTVTLEGRPYAAAAVVRVRSEPPSSHALCGSFPVQVPLVVGLCSALPSEVAHLSVGDAWCCGEGWWIDVAGGGRGALVSPGGETGVAVDLAPDGSIVVRPEVRQVAIEEASEPMDESTEVTDALTEAVGETPVVVRVELGSVSLLAKEWASLRPGDVIRSDQRVGEPVRLRIAGREVARGELVNVEGELGVRIVSVVGESGS